MLSNNRHSAIESNSAFTAKVEDLVREIVIQNDILCYRIESKVEHVANVGGEDNFMPVIRIIAYFEDTVSQIADLLSTEFDIVAESAVDKKKSGVESFSYKHIQYMVCLKGNRRELTEYKRFGNKQFEIQICSMLQDAWAGIEKELGYDSATFPESGKRDLYRVGALLEMADLEFLKIRSKFVIPVEPAQEPASEPVETVSARTYTPVTPAPQAQLRFDPLPPQPVHEPVVNDIPAPPVYQAPEAPVYQAPAPVYQAPPAPVFVAPAAPAPAPAPFYEASAPVMQAPMGIAPRATKIELPETIPSDFAAPTTVISNIAEHAAPAAPQPAPAPFYEAPAPIYEAPAPVFQAPPAPVFEAPAPTPVYEAPAPVYQAPPAPVFIAPTPAPVYQAPTPAYQAPPAPVFAAPAPAPVHEAPAPVYQAPPAPVFEAPAPVYETPAPVFQAPPAPVYQAQPAPVQETPAPAPVFAAPEPVYHAPAPIAEPIIPAAPVQQIINELPKAEAIDSLKVNTNGNIEKTAEMSSDPDSQPFFEDLLDEQNVAKSVVKAAPLDENAPITDASLKEYVLKSKLLKEVDKQIAERAGARINQDIDIEGDVERLRFLKVYTLKQLHDRIKDNKDDIVAFAEKWIGKDNGGSFDSGISLFYLEYLLVGKKNDPAFAVEYVVKFISDNDYSARYIIPTYNSIRNTEAPNFSHLTLK